MQQPSPQVAFEVYLIKLNLVITELCTDLENTTDVALVITYCYDFGILYNYKFVLVLGTEQVINILQSFTEFRDQVRFCFDELKSATC